MTFALDIASLRSRLRVTVRHRIHDGVFDEMARLLHIAGNGEGAIVPLLGPTRCGKTLVLHELHDRLSQKIQGPGSMLQTSDFGMGVIPPKPNDRDLYRAMLQAIGYDCGPKERTSLVRERLVSAIRSNGTRVIALDECSHCAERGANLSARAATDHFKTIVDETGICLVLVGLPKFQALIDENEQFRDRALRTVLFPPYAWSRERDREDFLGAFLAALSLIVESGISVDFDDIDVARRMYGVTGGRVGLVLKIFDATVAELKQDMIDMADIARAVDSAMQKEAGAIRFFRDEPPSDRDLTRAYVRVMEEAQLPVHPQSLDELDAVMT